MKKKLLFILAYAVSSTMLNAQTPNWSWAESSSDEGTDKIGYDISADVQGNTYSVGVFKDTITFGSTQLLATQGTIKAEVFVVKYDPSGNVLWAIQSTGGSNPEGNGIYVDNSGNCYITGKFQNTIHFGGVSITSGNAFGAMYVAKIDANGTAQWVEQYGASGFSVISGIIGESITMDNAQDLYVAGVYKGDADFGNGNTINNPSSQAFAPFVAKLSATDGTSQWAYGATGGNSSSIEVNDIEIGSDIYIAGTYKGSVYFGTNDTLTSTANREGFLAKFTTAGAFSWAYKPTTNGGSGTVIKGTGIGVDNQNNPYYSGYFSDDLTFGSTTLSCGGFDDCSFIAKLDASGTPQWATQVGDANSANIYAVDMYTGTNGTSYITGSMSAGTVNVASDVLTAVNGDVGDLFIIEVDASGVPQWGVKATNAAGYGDGANGIVGTSNGIYITGFYRSTLTAGTTISETGGTDDNFFVIKLDESVVGIEEGNIENGLWAYPNPFKNTLTIANNNGTLIKVNLIDLTGKMISTKVSNDNRIEMNTTNLPQGIYFLNVTDIEKGIVITTQKVIKY